MYTLKNKNLSLAESKRDYYKKVKKFYVRGIKLVIADFEHGEKIPQTKEYK